VITAKPLASDSDATPESLMNGRRNHRRRRGQTKNAVRRHVLIYRTALLLGKIKGRHRNVECNVTPSTRESGAGRTACPMGASRSRVSTGECGGPYPTPPPGCCEVSSTRLVSASGSASRQAHLRMRGPEPRLARATAALLYSPPRLSKLMAQCVYGRGQQRDYAIHHRGEINALLPK